MSVPSTPATSSLHNDLPSPPDLVLRVGFAGKRDLDAESLARLRGALLDVLAVIGWRLVEIAPMDDAEGQRPVPAIARYYSKELPELRLITGLCEGADEVAFRSLEELEMPLLKKDHAAVLPFPLADYRRSRGMEFHPEFDRQAEKCSYIVVPDGIYEKKDPLKFPAEEVALADRRRRRGYRCQSALLLRQSDIVIAAVDLEGQAKPGGTLETIRSALELDLPVILIHPADGRVTLIEPGDDLPSVLDEAEQAAEVWKEDLAAWVTQIVADPERSEDAAGHASASHGVLLMEEFFSAAATPPLEAGESGATERKRTNRERFWSWFEKRFKEGLKLKPSSTGSARREVLPQGPYAPWMERISRLGSHYSGLYRGTYFLNHFLAVSAVFLATLSLLLLGHADSPAGRSVTRFFARGAPVEHFDHPPWLFWTLLFLGLAKLVIVCSIFRNTHRANHGNWNDKAVDYRYFAERLRAFHFLPLTGSHQPPAVAPVQYASRVVRQSAVDWLFNAVTRSVSPAAGLNRTAVDVGIGRTLAVRLLEIDPLNAMRAVEEDWIAEQALYHRNNAVAMERMSKALENLGRWANLAVILIVIGDVAFVIAHGRHLVHDNLVITGAVLVFLAAVLPAAVAGLNGIRFQSECQRLAERSAVMHAILRGRRKRYPSKPRWWERWLVWKKRDHRMAPPRERRGSREPRGRLVEAAELRARIEAAKEDPATDPGSWTLESLRFSEKVAGDFTREVAEWSVLYAKELVDP